MFLDMLEIKIKASKYNDTSKMIGSTILSSLWENNIGMEFYYFCIMLNHLTVNAHTFKF